MALALFCPSGHTDMKKVAQHAQALLDRRDDTWEIIAEEETQVALRNALPKHRSRIYNTAQVLDAPARLGGALTMQDWHVHGGLLATTKQIQRAQQNTDDRTLEGLYRFIDLLYLDLTWVGDQGVEYHEVNLDFTLVYTAFKGGRAVTVPTPAHFQDALRALKKNAEGMRARTELQREALFHAAKYALAMVNGGERASMQLIPSYNNNPAA